MFELNTCVAFITNNAAKKIADAFNERLTTLGVTRVQWIALFFLGNYDSMTQSDLAEKMNIKASSVARLMDRMEREKYIVRIKDEKDKRITNLKLTEKGMKLREELIPEGEKLRNNISMDITEEEMEIFLKVLEKMVTNIN